MKTLEYGRESSRNRLSSIEDAREILSAEVGGYRSQRTPERRPAREVGEQQRLLALLPKVVRGKPLVYIKKRMERREETVAGREAAIAAQEADVAIIRIRYPA